MIPGVMPVGQYAVSELPANLDLSVGDPLSYILAHPLLPKTYLLVAEPYDPNFGVTPKYFSNNGYATEPGDDTLPNELFPNRLATPLNVSSGVMTDGRLRASAIPSFGDIEIINTDRVNSDGDIYGDQDYLLEYSWAQRDLTVYVGHEEFEFSEFGPIFTGMADDITWDNDLIRLRLRGPEYSLQKPIQPTLYRGMGAEGKYDGVNDYSVHASHISVQSCVIQFWARCDGNNALSNTQVIMSHASIWTSAGIDWYIEVSTAGIVSARLYRGAAGLLNSITYNGVDVRDSARRHYALVLGPGASGCIFYVNGQQIGTTTEPGFVSVTGNLEIGRRNGNADSFFNGTVDEVKFYKVTQSRSQILADMNREVTPTASDFHGYWKYNEATGTSLADSSGNGKTGTATGMTWSNSLEGGDDVAGKPKPLAYGPVREARPILLDSLNLVYQVHDRSVQSVSEVKDQGVLLTSAGDVSDLYATSVTSGQFKTNLARGLIRLGTKPTGQLTATVEGDNTGGYVSTTADVIRRIVTRHGGLTDDDIDLGSTARLNTANSSAVYYWIGTEPVSIDTIISELASSVGAWWTYTRAGLFKLQRLEDPSTLSSVGVINDSKILAGGIRRLPCAPPSKRQRLAYQRIFTVQQPDALGASLTEAQKRFLAEEYRYVISETDSADIIEIHKDAEDVESVTCLDTRASAQAEADRRQALFGTKRAVYSVPLANGLFQFNIGEVWILQVSRFNLSAGKSFIVVGLTENVSADEITLELWG